MVSQTGGTRVVRPNPWKGPNLSWKRAKRKFWGQKVLFGTKFLKLGHKRANLATLVIYCDHEPLVKAFYSSTQRDNVRECRHLSEIASLCTNLKYIKGCDSVVADALSRVEIAGFFNMLLRLTGMILQKLSKTTMF